MASRDSEPVGGCPAGHPLENGSMPSRRPGSGLGIGRPGGLAQRRRSLANGPAATRRRRLQAFKFVMIVVPLLGLARGLQVEGGSESGLLRVRPNRRGSESPASLA